MWAHKNKALLLWQNDLDCDIAVQTRNRPVVEYHVAVALRPSTGPGGGLADPTLTILPLAQTPPHVVYIRVVGPVAPRAYASGCSTVQRDFRGDTSRRAASIHKVPGHESLLRRVCVERPGVSEPDRGDSLEHMRQGAPRSNAISMETS